MYGIMTSSTSSHRKGLRNHTYAMRIVSWNVNGLYNTLKDASVRYSSASNYFSEVLKADIVCFQEAKIQEGKLEKWMACVPGYESFWAFSVEKKGYSGVVTYVKEELSPLDARADCLGDFDDPAIQELCSEGRLVDTDHGSFILINVYAPNAGDEEGRPRLGFKLQFLEALRRKCDELVCSGRHVVIVGDFNVAHKDNDVHKNWNVRDVYSSEEIAFMDTFFAHYVDLFRYFHPDAKDVFSVWNQKKEARIHNEGLRIDYAVCDKGFLSQVLDTEIVKMFPKQWSDHAAVVLTLKEQPLLPTHAIPVISSRNMKQFQEDHRQKKLTTLFSSAPLKYRPELKTVQLDNRGSQSELSSTFRSVSSPVKADFNVDRDKNSTKVEPPSLDSNRSMHVKQDFIPEAASPLLSSDKERGTVVLSPQCIDGSLGFEFARDHDGETTVQTVRGGKIGETVCGSRGEEELCDDYNTEAGVKECEKVAGEQIQVISSCRNNESSWKLPPQAEQSNKVPVKRQKSDARPISGLQRKGPGYKQHKIDPKSVSSSAIPGCPNKQRSLTSYFQRDPD